MRWLDSMCEQSARQMARRLSRRGVLGSLGAVLVGVSATPLLPIARGADRRTDPHGGQGAPVDPGDPTQCDYWRYCAIDGFLCSCCGGSQHSCPPGTTPSPTTWIGTCHNPGDGRDYIVSYNDCCGKSSCGRCLCNRNEGDMPLYVPFRSNDYDWCAGAQAGIPYNCSISRILGVAK